MHAEKNPPIKPSSDLWQHTSYLFINISTCSSIGVLSYLY